MFEDVRELIKERKYEEAEEKLMPIYKSNDSEKSAIACFLLGVIFSKWDNKKRNVKKSKDYFKENIRRNYPQPRAYYHYAKLEDDKNVSINYLRKGLEKFPNFFILYDDILSYSVDKESVISEINEKDITNIIVLENIIRYYIKSSKWGEVKKYTSKIIENNDPPSNEKMSYLLLEAFSYAFSENPDYRKAQTIFANVITEDIDNKLSYSHYLGYIYSSLKLNEKENVLKYFDRIPANNSICDFEDGMYYVNIYVDFLSIYKLIFDSLIDEFSKEKDNERKSKAKVLYSLYLYNPSDVFDICRYKRSDMITLEKCLKKKFNPKVASALVNMYLHFGQYIEAYDTCLLLYSNGINSSDINIDISSIIDEVDDKTLLLLVDKTINFLEESDFWSNSFLSDAVNGLVEKLFSQKLYNQIRKIANNLSYENISEANIDFECAFSYGENKEKYVDKVIDLYERIIHTNPTDTAALNNLGVAYAYKNNIEKAVDLYRKAHELDPKNELYKNNLRDNLNILKKQRKEEIQKIANDISLNSLEEIGYTNDYIAKFKLIPDEKFRNILIRDLKECAIAVVAKQNKLAMIMCGSIIEALIMQKIKENGVSKYDLSDLPDCKARNKSNYPVDNMGLNELLFVADKMALLDKNNYHLGHFIRDYRNIVHPAKEIREQQEISDENSLTMWAVLKRITNDLLK